MNIYWLNEPLTEKPVKLFLFSATVSSRNFKICQKIGLTYLIPMYVVLTYSFVRSSSI